MTDKPDKAALVKQYMEQLGVIREEAEFMAAMELGEITGCVQIVDGDAAEDTARSDKLIPK